MIILHISISLIISSYVILNTISISSLSFEKIVVSHLVLVVLVSWMNENDNMLVGIKKQELVWIKNKQ